MKYHADLKKRDESLVLPRDVCYVSIDCDDWELYERLVKIIEKELKE